MAKAVANCKCESCGCEFTFEKICYNRKMANDFEDWAADNITECRKCRQERIEKERLVLSEQRRAENEANAEKSEMIGLPVLEGTEKQIAWANTIRLAWIDWAEKENDDLMQDQIECEEDGDEIADWLKSDVEEAKAIIGWVKENIISASYWIENRNMQRSIWRFAKSACKEDTEALRAERVKKEIEEREKAEREAEEKAEREAMATVAPEGVENPSIAVITSSEDCVFVSADKDEMLRGIVKSCGMKWDGTKWVLQIRDMIHEESKDLMAYIGNRLLRAGFAIRIFDPDVLDAAVEGTAKPRASRVLSKKGEHFRLEWDGYDDEIYRAAKRIKGAKYEDFGFSIPFSSWRMAFDLAELNNVAVSDGAKKAADDYQNSIVNKRKPEIIARGKNQKDKLANVLESENDVISDLID